jgi:hypothetical protein
MALKAAYNAGSTKLEGFYDEAIHGSIPSPNITVTAGERDQAMLDQAAGKVLKVTAGVLTASDPVIVLADYKAAKNREVDALAMREFRKHHDFDNAGGVAYQLKLSEWLLAKDDGSPTGAEYPMLEAQRLADGVSLATAITDFGTARGILLAELADIEVVRLNTREAITAAANVAAVDALMVAIAWPV